MIAFDTPRKERQFRLESAKASTFFSTDRKCCLCGEKRRVGDLVPANPGPYTRFNPKRNKCKGGCDAKHC